MNDPVLVAAFFDEPGLLAVRFANPQAGGAAGFAAARAPDVGRAGCLVVGAGVVALLVGVPVFRGCDDADRLPQPVITAPVARDSLGGESWRPGLAGLADDLAPARADLRPWAVRTLLDLPREIGRNGDATGGWLKPRCAAEDLVAKRRGARLADLLAAAGAGRDLAVILDVPGPQAVAAAAGMAARCDPVFTMDNLPHPAAVVPSAQTLAAAVYWRPLLAASRHGRPEDAPAVFVLEGDRLAPYANQVDRFDNRSLARLPDVAGFRALGVGKVLYVRAERGQVAEAEDLNPLFTALAAHGVEVRHMALAAVDEAAGPEPEGPAAASTVAQRWFWARYWYRPAGADLPTADDPDAAYRAQPHPARLAIAGLDGGAARHAQVLDRLGMAPPPAASGWGSSGSGSSGGGSWFRSSGSHFG